MSYDFKQIRTVMESPGGQELTRYLLDTVNAMERIDSVDDLAQPIPLAIEFKAQKKAAAKLRGILSTVVDIPGTGTLKSTNEFASGL